MKIVSLLPSATEIICQLGLRDQLVGVSHECNYPTSVIGLPIVTTSSIPHDISSREIDGHVREQLMSSKALYSLNMDVMKQLAPDIIVTQALCEVCAVSEDEVNNAVCSLPGNPDVINLEPMCLKDVFDTLLMLGEATDRIDFSHDVVKKLQNRVDVVAERTGRILEEDKPGVTFLEWLDPLFNAGHWTPELIEYAGGINMLGNKNQPSETIPWESVKEINPDVIFIACCGYDTERTLEDMPILASNTGWDDLRSVKNKRVYICNGNAYFSSPGPRLVDSLEILAHTLHPDNHLLPDNLPGALKYYS